MSIRLVFRSIWCNQGNTGQRIRRTLSAMWWQFHKRCIRRPVEMRLINGRRFHAYPDCAVSSALIYSDFPEFHELQFIRSHVKRGEVVIDVGANVGHIGLLISDVVDAVDIYSFEPTPVTHERLRENWEANGLPVNHLYQIALGDHCGEAFIRDVSHPDSMNSLVSSSVPNGRTVMKVPLRTLDSFRDSWADKSIGLIKIDVEGHEPAVIEGARQTLNEDRPRLLMFESLDGGVEPRIAVTLRDAGYVIFQMDRRGRPDFAQTDGQNLFAVPQELRSEVARV